VNNFLEFTILPLFHAHSFRLCVSFCDVFLQMTLFPFDGVQFLNKSSFYFCLFHIILPFARFTLSIRFTLLFFLCTLICLLAYLHTENSIQFLVGLSEEWTKGRREKNADVLHLEMSCFQCLTFLKPCFLKLLLKTGPAIFCCLLTLPHG
jgi:hypothetical protein